MKKNKQNFQKEWAKVIAKAWSDERFKEKLLKHPTQTLEEMGIEIPSGWKVEIHPQEKKVIHLTLPEKPSGEFNETELKLYAAGANSAKPYADVSRACGGGCT